MLSFCCKLLINHYSENKSNSIILDHAGTAACFRREFYSNYAPNLKSWQREATEFYLDAIWKLY